MSRHDGLSHAIKSVFDGANPLQWCSHDFHCDGALGLIQVSKYRCFNNL